VDPSVVLARRVDFAGAVGPVAMHVGVDACLGASHLLRARLPAAFRFAAVYPVGVLDLKGSAAQRANVLITATNLLLTTFHLTDALQAVVGYGRTDAINRHQQRAHDKHERLHLRCCPRPTVKIYNAL